MISRMASFKFVAVLRLLPGTGRMLEEEYARPRRPAPAGPYGRPVPSRNSPPTWATACSSRKTSRRFHSRGPGDAAPPGPMAATSIRNVTVQVEGHADERGTREYNIALSARRATAAREFLIAQGVTAKPDFLHRLWQGTPGGAVRCRTMLVAEPPCRDRHHRWGKLATVRWQSACRTARLHSLNFTAIAVQFARLR